MDNELYSYWTKEGPVVAIFWCVKPNACTLEQGIRPCDADNDFAHCLEHIIPGFSFIIYADVVAEEAL